MRPRLTRSRVAVGAATLFMALGQDALADQVTLTFTGNSGSTAVSYSLNGNAGSITPGTYFWNETLANGATTPVATFCIDLTHAIPGKAVYNVVAPASAPTIAANGSSTGAVVNAIEALYGDYYKSAWNSQTTVGLNNTNGAFQLALYELVYDGASDIAHPTATNFFSTGIFQSTDPNAAAAQAMLNNVLENTAAGDAAFASNGMTLEALTNSSDQTQLIVTMSSPPPTPPSVPSPPGIILAGLGLFALAGRARWTRLERNPA